jgi:hypothetical protein
MATTAKLLKDITTTKSGESFDMGRVIGLLLIAAVVPGSIRGMWIATPEHPFAWQDFGIGVGSLITGIGALLWAKKDTEPDQPPAIQPNTSTKGES